MENTPEVITELKPDEVFVFGSNLAGIHGKGAALAAVKFGAEPGIGYGLVRNTFAIPTKDKYIRTLPLKTINIYVDSFIHYATLHPEFKFLVTPIGCGLAGYSPAQIAPMFKKALSIPNIILPKSFTDIITQENESTKN